MKRSQFAISSETTALQFLHATDLDLPIPRIIDSMTIDGQVWIVMTRLPGQTMLNLAWKKSITEDEVRGAVKEVHAVIRKLCTLTTPPLLSTLRADSEHQPEMVMRHPSGRGLPWAKFDLEFTIGPCTLADLYAAYTTAIATHHPWTAPRDEVILGWLF